MTTVALHAPTALLPEGWAADVRIEIDRAGTIVAVEPGGAAAGAERLAGPAIPGMANLHGHAFQRAMAGLTEHVASRDDSFWTWRRLMYDFVARLDPDQVEAIAAQVYVEMVTAGYTSVAEFHYLHHDVDGRPYADVGEMAGRLVAAAERAGIGLTLLPTLYAHGGFGGAPALSGQRRFLNDAPAFARLLGRAAELVAGAEDARLGIALHSLRAVTPELMGEAITALEALAPGAPIHIHLAEQEKEVADCVAWSGARPVAWLLANAPVGPRWCAVHATHMTGEETEALAASGAVAGLCPTTEANLGDGIFPLPPYLGAGGHFGIGSDSHVSVSPVEELRWLEYGQRLERKRRNVAASPEAPSVGAALWRRALAGGARATGRASGAIAPGQRADLLVLDPDHPSLVAREGDSVLDSLVFAGNTSPLRDVMVGGHWRVRERRHAAAEAVLADYRRVVSALVSG